MLLLFVYLVFFFNYSLLARKTKTFKLNTNTNKIVYVFCKYLNKRVIHPPPPPTGITWNIKTLNDFINPFLIIFSESIPGFLFKYNKLKRNFTLFKQSCTCNNYVLQNDFFLQFFVDSNIRYMSTFIHLMASSA